MTHDLNHGELSPPQVETIPNQPDLICGYPKTGRTWLRFMLASAIADHHELGVEVDLTNAYSIVPNSDSEIIPGQPDYSSVEGMPRIEMSHAPYSSDRHDGANIAFLTRDPRDIMVSHWLHNTKQIKQSSQSLAEFIRDPGAGMGAFLGHLEGWAQHLNADQVIPYEYMRPNPGAALTVISNRFNLALTSEEITRAVDASTMEAMRRKEIERGIAGHQDLYDRGDPEARRVRRGKVGGFTDYLSPDDELFISEQVAASSDHAKGIIALTGYFSR